MRGKHHEDEHMDESWLIPYADLLTLLLALFIVLFASSTVDKDTLTAMQMAFFEEYNGVLPEQAEAPEGQGGLNPTVPAPGAAGNKPAKPAQDDETSGTQTAEELISVLHENFAEYVALNGLESEMRLEAQPEGLLITLTSDVWFPSGSAEINASQKQVAAQIAEMIAKVQTESQVLLSVIVSGHTDNVPIHGSVFPDNWWLSVTRAVNFMQELMNDSALGPANFSARGFGEFEPVDTNDTPEGRQHNRRVEVMISPKVGA
jgi:chemotaxis protein MotB